MNSKLSKLIKEYMPQIISDRRRFHSNPEIAKNEFATSEYIKQVLKQEKIEFEEIAGTGIVAIIKGEKKGNTIMIRGDMDALPITEETNLEFSSKISGMMHACGHDIHTSNLLGLARILNHFKEEINGNIKFCFQPAEEGAGGALLMVKDGILDNPKVDYTIGMHIDPSIALGSVAIEDGPITAFPRFFQIKLFGKGGHGSAPFRSIDPILPGMKICENLNSITKQINPLHLNVVQVCSFVSGTAPAIIPDECTIKGTVRTHYREDEALIKKKLYEIVESISKLYSLEYEVEYWGDSEPVLNNPEFSEMARNSVKDIFDKGLVKSVDFKMVGEDFSQYSIRVPSTFLVVGCSDFEKSDKHYPLHNSKFNPDERVLEYGAKALGQIALDYLGVK